MEQTVAATKIQAVFRGSQLRSRLRKYKSQAQALLVPIPTRLAGETEEDAVNRWKRRRWELEESVFCVLDMLNHRLGLLDAQRT